MLTRVRAAVAKTTSGKQLPWEATSLMGDFFFTPVRAAPDAPKPAPVSPPAPQADNESLFWQSIRDSRNAADFKDYLARWPNGTFAELAKRRIAEIEKAVDVTPPAPEKPAPPAAPPAAPGKRVSTFEVGVWIDGNWINNHFNVVSAQECQSLCLKHPQCVAWAWAHETHEAAGRARDCHLLRTVSFRIKQDSDTRDRWTSGAIRATPAAAAPAQPPAPAPKAQPAAPDKPGPAPIDRQAQIREIIRKADAKEPEDGFCSRVTWPNEGWGGPETAQRRAGQFLFSISPALCMAMRIDSEFLSADGKPCKRLTHYACWRGTVKCSTHRDALAICRQSDGRWTLQ